MHLLPAGVRYWAGDGAQSLVESLPSDATDSNRRVLVLTDNSPAPVPDLRAFFGLVAINRSDLSPNDLRANGFAYVRRLAMLPSAKDLRWLIPLDSPAISAGALHLYAAVRASARIKHALARGAARIGYPFWYRDELLVACRETPPLEENLGIAVNNPDVRLAISSGAPGPSDRRKPSIAIVDMCGALRGVAKVAVSPITDGLVRHEASTLRSLENSARGVLAPRVMLADVVDGKYTLVQSPLTGRPARAELTVSHRRFLDSLRCGEHEPLFGTTWGTTLRDRVARASDEERALVSLFQTLSETLSERPVPRAVVHGDFVPWNLRENAGVLAACDWENATIDGVALVDEMHHRLVVGYLMSDWTVDRAVSELERLTSTRPLGLDPDDAQAIAGACVLEFCLRLVDHGHSNTNEMLRWYRAVAGRMHASLTADTRPRAAI